MVPHKGKPKKVRGEPIPKETKPRKKEKVPAKR